VLGTFSTAERVEPIIKTQPLQPGWRLFHRPLLSGAGGLMGASALVGVVPGS
jgi:hypothetical protein